MYSSLAVREVHWRESPPKRYSKGKFQLWFADIACDISLKLPFEGLFYSDFGFL